MPPSTLPQRTAVPDIWQDPGERDDSPPLFNVVLLDDNEHTYEYVIEMLCTLFFLSPEAAYGNACEVDKTGRTVVITCDKDAAEFGRDQIHSYGADPRMAVSKGSMSARVEPAGA